MSNSTPPKRSSAAAPRRRSLLVRLARAFAIVVVVLLVLAFWGWGILAVYFSNLPGQALRTTAAWIYGLAIPASFIALRRRRQRALAAVIGLELVVFVWWWFIPASNDRDWKTEVAVLPYAEIGPDRVTLHNVRYFDYRSTTDFTPRYEDRTYDLAKLDSVDFVKSHWDGLENVAHTMLSFGFGGEDWVTVSVETRLEKGEPQTGLRGLFKQYETIYIFADERDLIRLRTDFRKEEVWVFPTTTTKQEARVLFLDLMETINKLEVEPEFYNTLTRNCTLGLVPHLRKARRPKRFFDIRLLLNGQSDRMAYENGWIRPDLPFDEMKKRHHVNQYVGDPAADASDYSLRIRPHLAR